MPPTDEIPKVDDDDKWQKFTATKAIVLRAIERDPKVSNEINMKRKKNYYTKLFSAFGGIQFRWCSTLMKFSGNKKNKVTKKSQRVV